MSNNVVEVNVFVFDEILAGLGFVVGIDGFLSVVHELSEGLIED